MKSIISIIIPTYNGEKTIKKTLDNLVANIVQLNERQNDKIIIIIRDDGSTDNTVSILKTYSAKYSFIKVYISNINEGMDENFSKASLLSKSEYLWYFGQDDFIKEGSVQTVISMIDDYDPNIIFLNAIMIRSNGQVVDDSLFNSCSLHKVPVNKVLTYKNGEEYFEDFFSGPTFLPTIIMKRNFWSDFDPSPFKGTAYVQAACLLLNMYKGKILAYTKPIVIGLASYDNWENEGNSLIKVGIGYLKMMQKVSQSPHNPVPLKILRKIKSRFLLNFYFAIGYAKNIGFIPDNSYINDLEFIFSGRYERLYLSYIINLNWKLQKPIYIKVKFIKENVLKVLRRIFPHFL